MTIQTLQRVLWRVRTKCPNRIKITNLELKRAIMIECGTSYETWIRNRKSLLELGWIKIDKTKCITLTGSDIRGEF